MCSTGKALLHKMEWNHTSNKQLVLPLNMVAVKKNSVFTEEELNIVLKVALKSSSHHTQKSGHRTETIRPRIRSSLSVHIFILFCTFGSVAFFLSMHRFRYDVTCAVTCAHRNTDTGGF